MNRTAIVLLILCVATAIIGSAAEAPASPASTDEQTTPKSMGAVPAFEAVFAIIGLLTMAIVLTERQKRT